MLVNVSNEKIKFWSLRWRKTIPIQYSHESQHLQIWLQLYIIFIEIKTFIIQGLASDMNMIRKLEEWGDLTMKKEHHISTIGSVYDKPNIIYFEQYSNRTWRGAWLPHSVESSSSTNRTFARSWKNGRKNHMTQSENFYIKFMMQFTRKRFNLCS